MFNVLNTYLNNHTIHISLILLPILPHAHCSDDIDIPCATFRMPIFFPLRYIGKVMWLSTLKVDKQQRVYAPLPCWHKNEANLL